MDCPRCIKILEHIESLVKYIPLIESHDVVSICDHCLRKERPRSSCWCRRIVDKFLMGRQLEVRESIGHRIKLWLKQAQHVLRNAAACEIDESKSKTLVRSDADLNVTKKKIRENSTAEISCKKCDLKKPIVVPELTTNKAMDKDETRDDHVQSKQVEPSHRLPVSVKLQIPLFPETCDLVKHDPISDKAMPKHFEKPFVVPGQTTKKAMDKDESRDDHVQSKQVEPTNKLPVSVKLQKPLFSETYGLVKRDPISDKAMPKHFEKPFFVPGQTTNKAMDKDETRDDHVQSKQVEPTNKLPVSVKLQKPLFSETYGLVKRDPISDKAMPKHFEKPFFVPGQTTNKAMDKDETRDDHVQSKQVEPTDRLSVSIKLHKPLFPETLGLVTRDPISDKAMPKYFEKLFVVPGQTTNKAMDKDESRDDHVQSKQVEPTNKLPVSVKLQKPLFSETYGLVKRDPISDKAMPKHFKIDAFLDFFDKSKEKREPKLEISDEEKQFAKIEEKTIVPFKVTSFMNISKEFNKPMTKPQECYILKSQEIQIKETHKRPSLQQDDVHVQFKKTLFPQSVYTDSQRLIKRDPSSDGAMQKRLGIDSVLDLFDKNNKKNYTKLVIPDEKQLEKKEAKRTLPLKVASFIDSAEDYDKPVTKPKKSNILTREEIQIKGTQQREHSFQQEIFLGWERPPLPSKHRSLEGPMKSISEHDLTREFSFLFPDEIKTSSLTRFASSSELLKKYRDTLKAQAREENPELKDQILLNERERLNELNNDSEDEIIKREKNDLATEKEEIEDHENITRKHQIRKEMEENDKEEKDNEEKNRIGYEKLAESARKDKEKKKREKAEQASQDIEEKKREKEETIRRALEEKEKAEQAHKEKEKERLRMRKLAQEEEAARKKQKALEKEALERQKALEKEALQRQKALEKEELKRQKALEKEELERQKALEKEALERQKEKEIKLNKVFEMLEKLNLQELEKKEQEELEKLEKKREQEALREEKRLEKKLEEELEKKQLEHESDEDKQEEQFKKKSKKGMTSKEEQEDITLKEHERESVTSKELKPMDETSKEKKLEILEEEKPKKERVAADTELTKENEEEQRNKAKEKLVKLSKVLSLLQELEKVDSEKKKKKEQETELLKIKTIQNDKALKYIKSNEVLSKADQTKDVTSGEGKLEKFKEDRLIKGTAAEQVKNKKFKEEVTKQSKEKEETLNKITLQKLEQNYNETKTKEETEKLFKIMATEKEDTANAIESKKKTPDEEKQKRLKEENLMKAKEEEERIRKDILKVEVGKKPKEENLKKVLVSLQDLEKRDMEKNKQVKEKESKIKEKTTKQETKTDNVKSFEVKQNYVTLKEEKQKDSRGEEVQKVKSKEEINKVLAILQDLEKTDSKKEKKTEDVKLKEEKLKDATSEEEKLKDVNTKEEEERIRKEKVKEMVVIKAKDKEEKLKRVLVSLQELEMKDSEKKKQIKEKESGLKEKTTKKEKKTDEVKRIEEKQKDVTLKEEKQKDSSGEKVKDSILKEEKLKDQKTKEERLRDVISTVEKQKEDIPKKEKFKVVKTKEKGQTSTGEKQTDETTKDEKLRDVTSKQDKPKYDTLKEDKVYDVIAKPEKLKKITSKENKVKDVTLKEEKHKDVTSKEEELKDISTKERKIKDLKSKEDKVKDVASKENKGKDISTKEGKIKDAISKEEKLKDLKTKEESRRDVISTGEKQKKDILKEDKVKDVKSKEEKLKDVTSKEDKIKNLKIKEERLRDVPLTGEKRKEDTSKEVKYMKSKEEQLKDVTSKQEKPKYDTLMEDKVYDVTAKAEKLKKITSKENKVKDVQLKEEKHKDVTSKEEELKDVSTKDRKIKDLTSKEEKVKDVASKENKGKDISTKEGKIKDATSKEEKLKDLKTKEESRRDVISTGEKQKKDILIEDKVKVVKSKKEMLKDLTPKEEKFKVVKTKEKGQTSTGEKQTDETTKDEKLRDVTSKEDKIKNLKIKEERLRDVPLIGEKQKEDTSKEDKVKYVKSKEEQLKDVTSKQEKPKDVTAKDKKLKDLTPKEKKVKDVTVKEDVKDISIKENKIKDGTSKKDKLKNIALEEEKVKDINIKYDAVIPGRPKPVLIYKKPEVAIKTKEIKFTKRRKELIIDLIRLKQSQHGPRERFKGFNALQQQASSSSAAIQEYGLYDESDLLLDLMDLEAVAKYQTDGKISVIIGNKIFKQHLEYRMGPELNYAIVTATPTETKTNPLSGVLQPTKHTSIAYRHQVDQDAANTKGIIRYALSDRSFIDKGWTMLPTEKVVRKMNVYRMRPAHPEFDWFEHNKYKRVMQYDTGEILADFDDDGRGRWFYRSGKVALDYYNAEEINAQQRFVVYSSGEPDDRGRTRPRTVLASFDYLGNGVVFDHGGKIRLKYNQTEGIVLDRSIGPVSNWKWHTLNDPPVLQQVMIDTQMPYKDPNIVKLGSAEKGTVKHDNEEMLAIEFDNFIKEKSRKLTQKFKPFQIKMKALKINEYFSLRVLDQATVYLLFRDGPTNIKINMGMVLDHKEIVDTDTAEVGEVSNSLERLPARTDSLAALQRAVVQAQRTERARVRHERRLSPPEPTASADLLRAGASRPMRRPLLTESTEMVPDTQCPICPCRKPSTTNLYYNTCHYN